MLKISIVFTNMTNFIARDSIPNGIKSIKGSIVRIQQDSKWKQQQPKEKLLFSSYQLNEIFIFQYYFFLMNQILKQIQQIDNWKNIYDSYTTKNSLSSISSKLVEQQNFENFQNFIENIVEKGPRKSKKRWVSNERRILHVILNCISVLTKSTVDQFKIDQIQRINRVFPYKDKHSVEYEIRKLSSNSKQNRRRWSQREENFLQDVFGKSSNKNKWNEIARELFIASKGEFFRQGKHCRQRFYKLKSGKGSEQNSSQNLPSLQVQSENSQQFHGRNSMNGENQMDIEPSIGLKMEMENFKYQDQQNCPVYNENHIRSNPKNQPSKKCTEKQSQKIKQAKTNVADEKSVEKQENKQSEKFITFSQKKSEKAGKVKDSLPSFPHQQEPKWHEINRIATRIDGFQINDQNNISEPTLMFPQAQPININNYFNGESYFPSVFPMIYPIWPLQVYSFNYQETSHDNQ